MKNSLSLVFAIAVLLAGGARAQNTPSDRADNTTQPALTIYNQNFFVAREHLSLDLKPGINRVEYAGIAAHLEPDSVILRDPAGRILQVLEQNYRNDPISQELLLSFYEGKTIDFLVQPGDKVVKGKIIRSGYVPSAAYGQSYPRPAMDNPSLRLTACSASACLDSLCFQHSPEIRS